MLFNSLHYLIFLPVVISVYFLLPPKHRWIFLLAASYYFYMSWRAEYIILIIISTVVDYICALLMSNKPQEKRKLFLLASLVVNLGLLGVFKYYNFFTRSISDLFASLNILADLPGHHLLLPVGISFYTFQTLSYTLDVYWGKREPERHFGHFALYVSFFPQLVAGPIERSTHLMPQLKETHEFNPENIYYGFYRILLGFVKKVVIADRVALLVNTVYNNPTNFNGPQFMLATFFFAVQIYCDFSGYSDIAIGTARIFGIDLMENFRRPYFAKSISEFWRRWHISLSTWFRDYLYIPLGGNRLGRWKTYRNLFLTFLLSGLWHGANWTFIIWGAFHGLLLMIERFINERNSPIHVFFSNKKTNILKLIFTFLLVNIGWIFFRANSLTDALYIVSHLLDGLFSFSPLRDFSDLGLTKSMFLFSLISIFGLFTFQFFDRKENMFEKFRSSRTLLQWSFMYATIILIIIMGVYGDESQFIYFQF